MIIHSICHFHINPTFYSFNILIYIAISPLLSLVLFKYRYDFWGVCLIYCFNICIAKQALIICWVLGSFIFNFADGLQWYFVLINEDPRMSIANLLIGSPSHSIMGGGPGGVQAGVQAEVLLIHI